MLTHTRLLVASALLAAVAACTTEVIEKQAAPDGTPTTDQDPNLPAGSSSLATAVTVDRVSVNQGVEVRLVKDGEQTETRNAPILTNRPALIRVHAQKASGTHVSKVTAKLHLTIDGEEKVLSDGPKSVGEYVDSDLASTFNFQLDAEDMTSDMEMSVELTGASDSDAITFPADDTTISLGAKDAAKLRVQLVPVKYQADGSDRLPNLDDKSVKLYRDALYQMYPVSDIEITKHDELAWDQPIAPGGDGWGQLLNAVMTMRQDEPVDPDVYYIGVFNPAANIRDYCGHTGCVLGIAPASGLSPELDTEMALRTALIVGYQTDHSGGTIAQELAHAMGRMHAPCGNPAAIDTKFPYKDAEIGSSGWDVVGKDLVSSDDHTDFMSYCSPVWVSDYTYKAIFDRMTKVKKAMASTTQTTKNVASSTPKEMSRLPLTKEQIAWTIGQP